MTVHMSILLLQLLVFYHLSSGEEASDFIVCEPGDLNVILAAPHGGNVDEESIENRDAGCYINDSCVWRHDCGENSFARCPATVVRDPFTDVILLSAADKLQNMTGLRPSVVLNLLKRIKFDANREINEATFANPIAIEAWEAYHACINQSKEAIEGADGGSGRGIYFDIHGHTHLTGRIELGYRIEGNQLDSGNFTANDSTILNLAMENEFLDFQDILRGNISFGAIFDREGYRVVPSPSLPGPGQVLYYPGGHNINMHGSKHGGRIDSIQVEIPVEYRESEANRDRLANTIAVAIDWYLQADY